MKNRYLLLFFILIIFQTNNLYGLEFTTISKRGFFTKFLSFTLPSNYISVVKKDDLYGDILIGTNMGLVWSNGRRFKLYGTKKLKGPLGTYINDISFYKKSGIYLATDSGISIFNYSSETWENYGVKNGFPTKYIEAIARIKNIILLGTWGHGLYEFNINTNKIKKIVIPKFYGKYITDILVDEKQKTIIVSSFQHGFAIKRGRIWKVYTTNTIGAKLPSNRVNCICGNGYHFFIGTKSGISEFNGNRYKIISMVDGLKSDNILSLYGSKDELWVGTDKGISQIIGDSIKNYPIRNSLFNGRILRVLSITRINGKLYLGTEHGGLLIEK